MPSIHMIWLYLKSCDCVVSAASVAVEVLLKAAGDAPIMVKKKWVVDGSKQVAYIIEFIRKYIKCEPQDSLVS